MKIASCLGLIRRKMLEAEETGKVDDFRKLVNTEQAIPKNLKLVEGLRTETLEKCSLKLKVLQPRVQIRKLTSVSKKDKEKTTSASPELRRRGTEGSEQLEVGAVKIDIQHLMTDENDDYENYSLEDHEEDPALAQEVMETEESSWITTECDICHLEVPESDLSTHIYSIHFEPEQRTSKNNNKKSKWQVNPETGKHRCDLCSKEFSSPGSLLNHHNIHMKLRYRCTLCEKTFIQSSLYKDHYEFVHLGIRFQCHKCHKLFSNHGLYQHFGTTSCGGGGGGGKVKPEKVHKCHLCRKGFAQFGNLQTHISSIHFQLRKYECHICGKKFKQKCHIDSHIKTIHVQNGRRGRRPKSKSQSQPVPIKEEPV